LAVLARNGSKLLNETREKKEKSKSRKKFWELAGSKMGSIMGIKDEKGEGKGAGAGAGAGAEGAGDGDYKASSRFAEHMQKKSEAVSAFAKSKSLAEQREFLPIFTCRDQLLTTIRDNQSTPPPQPQPRLNTRDPRCCLACTGR
jgi:pre-mRNA-splicing factor ATP-dependent RNA helicase DHX38/PRP16